MKIRDKEKKKKHSLYHNRSARRHTWFEVNHQINGSRKTPNLSNVQYRAVFDSTAVTDYESFSLRPLPLGYRLLLLQILDNVWSDMQ